MRRHSRYSSFSSDPQTSVRVPSSLVSSSQIGRIPVPTHVGVLEDFLTRTREVLTGSGSQVSTILGPPDPFRFGDPEESKTPPVLDNRWTENESFPPDLDGSFHLRYGWRSRTERCSMSDRDLWTEEGPRHDTKTLVLTFDRLGSLTLCDRRWNRVLYGWCGSPSNLG